MIKITLHIVGTGVMLIIPALDKVMRKNTVEVVN